MSRASRTPLEHPGPGVSHSSRDHVPEHIANPTRTAARGAACWDSASGGDVEEFAGASPGVALPLHLPRQPRHRDLCLPLRGQRLGGIHLLSCVYPFSGMRRKVELLNQGESLRQDPDEATLSFSKSVARQRQLPIYFSTCRLLTHPMNPRTSMS